MPSATFLKLPAEKREKLLEAAAREFAQRPYNEASINQIVKDAAISRGSFYMYFQDKEELFRYVLRQDLDQLTGVLESLLQARNGDIFAALPDLYDFLRGPELPKRGQLGLLDAIFRQNRGMQRSGVLELLAPGEFLGRLADSVDASLLDARSREEVCEMLSLLLSVVMPVLYRDPESDDRQRLDRILGILYRGMGAKTAVPQVG